MRSLVFISMFSVTMAKTRITTDFRNGGYPNPFKTTCAPANVNWVTVPGNMVVGSTNFPKKFSSTDITSHKPQVNNWRAPSYPNHNRGWYKWGWNDNVYANGGPDRVAIADAAAETCEAIPECMMVIINDQHYGASNTGDMAAFYDDSTLCIPTEGSQSFHDLTIIRYQVPPAKCSTLTCPTGYAAKGSAATIDCASSTCTENDDRDTCCDPTAKCSTLTCPTGYVAKSSATTIDCANSTCTENDRDTCCDPGCSVFDCGPTKKQKAGVILPTGKQPHAKYCCEPKVRGCKSKMSAFNRNQNADIDDPSLCITSAECYHGNVQGSSCVCDSGYGGRKCNIQTSAHAKKELLKGARIHDNPTFTQLRERRHVIKEFTKEILLKKLETLPVKEAVKESRFKVDLQDFSKKTQKLIEGLGDPMIAISPQNEIEDDTCHEGAGSSRCVTFDLDNDKTDKTITIVSADAAVGSWAVLARGSTIFTKQTRTGETTFDMQCWDEATKEWSAPTSKDVSIQSETYECQNYVFLVASQAGVCTGQCGDHGTCAADGEFYVCQCDDGWMGSHCDVVDTRSHCFETDCANYGGYKTDAGACDSALGTCTVANCCNFPSQSDYNTACETYTSFSSYLNARCCDRTAC